MEVYPPGSASSVKSSHPGRSRAFDHNMRSTASDTHKKLAESAQNVYTVYIIYSAFLLAKGPS